MPHTVQALSDKRLFLFDMDGTLYLDEELFDGAKDILKRIRDMGGRYLFLTNNSSRGVDAYVQKMHRLGIEAVPSDFFTSTDATVLYIRRHYPSVRFYAMGTRSFLAQLRAEGISVTEDVTDETVGGVILSNDTELTFAKLARVSELLLTRDIPYLATNPDWVCPASFGCVPDCGSFAEMLYRATGKRPYFIGKPRPDMILISMQAYGYEREQTLMIGDRLYTDIASGVNAGVDTVFVLSGEGTLADLAASEVKPTYVMQNVRELCEAISPKI